MHQRTRMATVLAVLAGGMTSTAALLAWMDPGWPGEPPPLTPEQLLTLARATVTESTSVDRQRWLQVEIAAMPTLPVAGPMLSATAVEGAHFLIDETGRLTRSRDWLAQSALGPPNTVQIRVLQYDDAGLTLAQWQALRALTQAINEVIPSQFGSLPIHVAPELAAMLANPRSLPTQAQAG